VRHQAYGKPSSSRVSAIVLAASLLVCATTTSAQDNGDIPIKERGVSITHEGPLHGAVRREAARLARGAASDQQTANKPDPNWFVRHPVIVGTLVGTGVGVALSRSDAIGGANHDPRVALLGAGVGAWSGLVASAARKARAREHIGLGTKIGIVASAVGLAVAPVVACYGAGGCGGSS
jgi:hypothetical protein